MIKFLKYLHYRLYSWDLRTWGEANRPASHALMGVSFLFLLNLMIPLIILQNVFEVTVFVDKTPKLLIVFVAMAVYYSLYFVFNHKKKYLAVCKQYKNESRSKKRINLFYIWLYVVLSFLVPILLILWLR